MSGEAPAHRPGTAAQGVAYLTASSAATVALGFVVHAIASRLLAKADYGRFVVALSTGTWLKILVLALFVPGLMKIVSEDHRRLRVALKAGGRWQLAAGLAVTVAVVAASPLLARVLGDPALTGLLMLAAAEVLVFSRFALRAYLMQALRRYRDAAAAFAAYGIVRAAVACGLVLLGLGAAGAMAGLIAGPLLAVAVAMVLTGRLLSRLPSVPYPALWSRSLSWTAMILPADVATATLMTVDVWIVKRVVTDASATGLYGAAYAVSRLADMALLGLNSAVFGRVSGAAAEGDRALACSVSMQSMRFVLIVLTPICCLAAGSAREIMALLFGAPYAEAGPLLTVLLTSASCLAALKLMLVLLTALDRPGHKSLLVVGLLPVGVVLCLVLAYRFGVVGAAVGSLATMATGLLIGVGLVCRQVGALPPPLTVLRCALAGGAVCVLGLHYPLPGLLVVPKLAALGLLYAALLLLTGEVGARDLRAIRRAAQ